MNKIFLKASYINYNNNKYNNKFKRNKNIDNTLKNKVIIKRELGEVENDTTTKDNNDTATIIIDNNNMNKKSEKKSGIGWLGTIIIIILSIVIVYVLYVGFRYYKRKKYQNPSFYYKITEEMFADITPIE